MAYAEVYRTYPALYTDLITEIQTALLDCGWTQVGATDIFKSASTDAKGNYCYIKVHDNGSQAEVQCTVRLNEAGTDVADHNVKYTDFDGTPATEAWFIVVYPLWFMAWGTRSSQTIQYQAVLGAGLFKPISGSFYEYFPYWVQGDGGTQDECGFHSRGVVYGFRHKTAILETYEVQMNDGHSYRAASSTSQSTKTAQHIGGGMIVPAPVMFNIRATLIGYLYNVVVYINAYLSSAQNEMIMSAGQQMLVNEKPYCCLPRVALWWNGGAGVCLFEAPGNFV
jgi:hypothetical protein